MGPCFFGWGSYGVYWRKLLVRAVSQRENQTSFQDLLNNQNKKI